MCHVGTAGVAAGEVSDGGTARVSPTGDQTRSGGHLRAPGTRAHLGVRTEGAGAARNRGGNEPGGGRSSVKCGRGLQSTHASKISSEAEATVLQMHSRRKYRVTRARNARVHRQWWTTVSGARGAASRGTNRAGEERF